MKTHLSGEGSNDGKDTRKEKKKVSRARWMNSSTVLMGVPLKDLKN